jgi:hypothetical protein
VATASPPAAVGTILETAGGPNRPIQHYSATGWIEAELRQLPGWHRGFALRRQTGPPSITRR